ncbi:MAG TPA: TrmH family RNA methyltransferase [Acidimicrobiales bacterium]
MKQLDGTGLKRLHRDWRRRTTRRVAMLLDGVATPVNVGSIARSAAAYGVEHLWLAGSTVRPDAPGARKTALGTERYLTWTEVEAAVQAVAQAKATGFTVVGVELAEGAVPLHELALPDAVCLVIGHEDHGISKACLAACDVVAYLPLVGKVGSLNVAQAASIALYETRRQEWATG